MFCSRLHLLGMSSWEFFCLPPPGAEYSYQADIWSFGLCVAQALCSDLLQWLNVGTDEKGNALPAVRRGWRRAGERGTA